MNAYYQCAKNQIKPLILHVHLNFAYFAIQWLNQIPLYV